jgi:hypothetical protein
MITKEELLALLRERNYIAAYSEVDRFERNDRARTEYVGLIANAIVDELVLTPKKEEAERVVYLRSILAWVLRDMPGLSRLYREQVRGQDRGGDPLRSVYEGIRGISDVAAGRKSLDEGIGETVDTVRNTFDDVSEQFRSGNIEEGVRSGLEEVGRFFESLNDQINSDHARREERPARPDRDSGEPEEDENEADES